MTLLGGTSVIHTAYQQSGDQVSGTYADNHGDAGVMQGRMQGNVFTGRLASQVFQGVACDFTSEVGDGGKIIQGTVTCNNGNAGSFALERQ
jgi:ribosomal protein L35AE/L33A